MLCCVENVGLYLYIEMKIKHGGGALVIYIHVGKKRSTRSMHRVRVHLLFSKDFIVSSRLKICNNNVIIMLLVLQVFFVLFPPLSWRYYSNSRSSWGQLIYYSTDETKIGCKVFHVLDTCLECHHLLVAGQLYKLLC